MTVRTKADPLATQTYVDAQVTDATQADVVLPAATAGDPGVWVTDGDATFFVSAAAASNGDVLKYNSALTPPFEWGPP